MVIEEMWDITPEKMLVLPVSPSGSFCVLRSKVEASGSVSQKRAATRSVKKGFGNPKHASASEAVWTEMPC